MHKARQCASLTRDSRDFNGRIYHGGLFARIFALNVLHIVCKHLSPRRTILWRERISIARINRIKCPSWRNKSTKRRSFESSDCASYSLHVVLLFVSSLETRLNAKTEIQGSEGRIWSRRCVKQLRMSLGELKKLLEVDFLSLTYSWV